MKQGSVTKNGVEVGWWVEVTWLPTIAGLTERLAAFITLQLESGQARCPLEPRAPGCKPENCQCNTLYHGSTTITNTPHGIARLRP